MLNLPSVTLLCVDCVDVVRAGRAVDRCTAVANFGAVKLLSSIPAGRDDVRRIAPLRSLDDYSRFMLRQSYAFVETEHMLVVQHDGFITRPSSWTSVFLNYDYVGAPWMDGSVGNGGFSLRSRRLMKRVSELVEANVPLQHKNEDEVICLSLRHRLEGREMKFAPSTIAAMFSIEHNEGLKLGDTFGFHGKHRAEYAA